MTESARVFQRQVNNAPIEAASRLIEKQLLDLNHIEISWARGGLIRSAETTILSALLGVFAYWLSL